MHRPAAAKIGRREMADHEERVGEAVESSSLIADPGIQLKAKIRILDAVIADGRAVADDRAGDGAFKLAWLILFRYFNQNKGYCFPSRETLANDLGVKTRSVDRYLKQLRPFILHLRGGGSRPGGNGQANLYAVEWGRWVTDDDEESILEQQRENSGLTDRQASR